ncbi:uncharacterized protein LOC115696294 [Cannabis sativa]|uniref:uncharacterized protein LOC115696294 n=1 Tax=Cannabis sativa TaxID=3483 RepID=UPI0011E01743|nr:uncharacterized protein LOC115696294 [Cannabis sativa]
MTSAWPFSMWRIDLIGALPTGKARVKYTVVAIDYYTKWVEVVSLRRIEREFLAVVHLRANGQFEVANKIIKKSLKTKLEKLQGRWVEELPNVLWSYRTTPRSTTVETPFSLVYECEAVLPIEMSLNSFRVKNINEEANQKAMEKNLDLLEERRDAAQMRLAVYHQRLDAK